MLMKVLTVVGLACFQSYAAIPAGIAFHLSPLTIFLSSVAGGMIGLFFTTILGRKIWQLFSKNRKLPASNSSSGFAFKLWNKFGVVGLGLLGTLTVGAPASVTLGMGLNGSVHKLFLWCTVGIVSRCLLLTAIAHFGNFLF